VWKSINFGPDVDTEELIALRRTLGLTQADMAAEMGLSHRAYQELEAGSGPISRRNRNAAERVSLRLAVQRADPKLAAIDIRLEATELAAMIGAEAKRGFGFRVIEIEFGPYGETIGRRILGKPFGTREQAESEATRLSGRFEYRNGFNAEHGYWWGRDESGGRSYRYVIEAA
jgi:transcriptional regulator with XRE-family HTH domain